MPKAKEMDGVSNEGLGCGKGLAGHGWARLAWARLKSMETLRKYVWGAATAPHRHILVSIIGWDPAH